MSSVIKLFRSDRCATVVFIACLVAAVPTLTFLGSEEWFNGDDLIVLSERTFTLDDILNNHSGHWVSIPFIAFHAIYALTGLHSYAPYQLLAVLSHVSVVGLGFAVMRRMSVQPWLATAVASTLVFFGAGAFNIFSAFQVSINGSLICGLGFLLLTDHEDSLDYRNVLGVVVALIGLMTSAAMVPMIIGVFTALLLRRGPAVTALQAALPALVFALWFTVYGTSQPSARGTQSQSLEMFVRLTTETLQALGQSPFVGGVLGLVILYGLGSACREAVRKRNVATLALPAALVVAWLGFSAAASLRAGNLAFDPDLPASGRYVYFGAALLLPLIAYGGSQLARVRQQLVLVPVFALALGVPRNIDSLLNYDFAGPKIRELVLSVAHSDLLDQLSGSYRPFLFAYYSTDVDWLRAALANGDIPNNPVSDRAVQLTGDRILALRQDPGADASCVPQRQHLTVTAHAGEVIKSGTRWIQVSLTDGHARSTPISYDRLFGNIVVQAGPVDVDVSAQDGGEALVCVGPKN